MKYSQIIKMNTDISTKEMRITEFVYENFPEYYKNTFKFIIRSTANKRYQLIKQLAEKQLNKKWTCEPMYRYYKDNFNG